MIEDCRYCASSELSFELSVGLPLPRNRSTSDRGCAELTEALCAELTGRKLCVTGGSIVDDGVSNL